MTAGGVPLARLPRIDRLELGWVTRVPAWHPEHATFEPFPVHAWLVHHPDGPILVDTGIGEDHRLLDELYAPTTASARGAVEAVGVDPDAVVAVVLSHLHFDHCGQQRTFTAPVHVQAAELDAARDPQYTVPEWARIEPARMRVADGDETLTDGIRLVLTPGHTPGHQSVVVEGGGRRVVLGAQCAFRGEEVRSGEPEATNLHDESWLDAARDSLARLRGFDPDVVELSHDPVAVTRP